MTLELHRKPDIDQQVREPTTTEGAPMALETNATIGMAIGLVMQRYGLTDERALAYLANVSQGSNLNLGTLAQQMVDEANGRTVPSDAG